MKLNDHQLVSDQILEEEIINSKNKLLSAYQVNEVLTTKTILKYSRSFPRIDRIYIYNPNEGFYQEFTFDELTVILTKIFHISKIPLSITQIKHVAEYMKYHYKAELGTPKLNSSWVAFNNGLLNVRTGQFSDWNPEIFVTQKIDDHWIMSNEIPKNFMTFLNTLCEGYQDRVNFLRAVGWAIFSGYTEAQFFLHMLGPGGSGKSTFISILQAMVGLENCITTTFPSLMKDPFETTALKNKKIICFNDVEHLSGDLSFLKALVGGDTIKGRRKHSMVIEDFVCEGIVLMTSNHPFSHTDTMNALSRRIRVFPANTVVKSEEKQIMLNFKNGKYEGILAPELSQIRSYFFNAPIDIPNIQEYLHSTKKMVSSLASSIAESHDIMNPLLSWINEEIEEGEGSYIGFRIKGFDAKTNLEISRRKLLYPTYRIWAEKRDMRPLGHKRFSYELLWNLKSAGFKVEKVRKIEGMYIKGIQIKDTVYNYDKYGAPLIQDTQNTSENKVHISGNKQHPYLIPDLYTNYKNKLQKTPLKEELNTLAKNHKVDIQKLVDNYFKDAKNPSLRYKDRMEEVMTRGVRSVKSFGAIPYSYIQMGTSPRIIPTSYGRSINNTKRIIREEYYSYLSEFLKTQNKTIIDLDLRSCYTSIILGLYPKELESIQLAIEGNGLWDYIYKEFEKNGRAHIYSKPAVKICTYSSFFMGGSRAMIEGILYNFRKDLGIDKSQFKDFPDYQNFMKIAQEVTAEMQNSSVITDFRAISNHIKDVYLGDYLIGPTGHFYKVTEDSFKTAYPNYLQSFEFALLADSTLRILEEFPDVELIGHFHDGNVLIVPQDSLNLIVERFTEKLQKLGYELGLSYPQRIEVKKVY